MGCGGSKHVHDDDNEYSRPVGLTCYGIPMRRNHDKPSTSAPLQQTPKNEKKNKGDGLGAAAGWFSMAVG